MSKTFTLLHSFHYAQVLAMVYYRAVHFIQEFPSVVVTYTLKAMKYSSKAAVQQFPRLLQVVERYPKTMDCFKKKVSSQCYHELTRHADILEYW